jgi:hypothetical protein
MNGRVYDPTIGRFLSADPIIQTIQLSQAINPFSYVMNMPLMLTDPSGLSWLSKLFHSIVSFVKKWISVIVNVALLVAFPYMAPWISSLISSAIAVAVNGGTIGSFAIGFVAGLVGGKLGGQITGGLTKAIGARTLAKAVLSGAVSGAVAGGISSTIMGGSFWQGFAAGALGGALGAGLKWEAEAHFSPAAKSGGSDGSKGSKSGASGEDKGRSLTADERAAYKGEIPDEALDAARIHEGHTPWWLRKDMAAVTLHDDIYFRSGEYVPGTAGGVELLGHELTHVVQYQHGLTVLKYMFASMHGYSANHYEVEAYSAGAQIRANWCSAHIGGPGC